MANDPLANAARLEELVGFDPGKRPSVSKEDLVEILLERKRVAKAAAKEQLKKATVLRDEMSKTRKKFEQEWGKNNKELGKLINGLMTALNGHEPEPEGSDGGDAAAIA